MNDEKKIDWFIKLEPELTIDDSERHRIEKKKLEQEKSEIVKKIPQLVDEATERIVQKLKNEGFTTLQTR